MKKLFLFFYLSVVSIAAFAAEQFVIFTPAGNHFPLVANGVPCPIYIDSSEDKGVMIAAGNLQQDILQVCGKKPELLTSTSSKRCIIAGTYGTPFIKKLMSAGKIDKKELDGKNEKYILQVIANPCEGIDEAVVIIGSDRRGTIYGIYELSEQMGVSPWYWWADVPVMKQANVYIKPGQYSDGEPAVTYRGIFLNDEAPCLTQLQIDIEQMAQANKETYEEACVHLKQQYDGYHFSENSEDIYNPFSLFNAFAQKKYANFWFSTGTPTFLIDILQESDFDIRELDNTTATAEQFDAPSNRITDPLPVLYQSGYLTIKGYDPDFQLYTLAYPNKEVRKGFIESLMPAYVHLPARENTFYVVSFIKDLRIGHLEECLERLKSFFASIPNKLNNKEEKHYQTIFYLFFRLMGQYIDVEVDTAIGRADAVVKLQDTIYVFEFKVDGTPEEALAQINSKGYAIPYQADHRKIVKVGVNFDSATRTIGEWKIELGS